MEVIRSPRSESLSIGSLIQNSVATLGNKCVAQEQDIEEKSQGFQELKNMCAKQEENISKQQLELEHLKMRTYTEVMNRDSFLAKFSSLRVRSEPLKLYMEKWFEWLNQIMLVKEDIQQFFGCIALKTKSEISKCQELVDMYHCALQQTFKVFGDLDGLGKKMKHEFEGIKTELRRQLSLRTQQERELEEQFRDIKKGCDETTKVIEVIRPQVAELEKTFEHLNNKLVEELKNIKSATNQLQTLLQEELIRKVNFSTKLKVTDELICKANIEMRDEELDVKSLDSKHKHLIVEGENYDSKMKDKLEELNSLQANYDSKRAQFCTLSSVNEDNDSLKLKIDELIEIHDNYKNKLADISDVERVRLEELNKINIIIKNKEIEKASVIQERLDIEEETVKLKTEFENNSFQRNNGRSETEKHYTELMKEKNSFLAETNGLTKQMKQATENKERFESMATNSMKEMRRVKDICAEADNNLFNYLTKTNVVQSGQRNQIIIVDEMVTMNEQEVENVKLNIQESEELQVQITKMEVDLSTQQMKYIQSLTDLQLSYREQLETKKKYLEDLRVKYEMEFKNKEQKKLDAMMELKEIKDSIADHQKKRKSMQNEIKLAGNTSWKYNNLIQRLEEKLKVVAKVATVSQPVKDVSSQDSRYTLKENLPLQSKLAGYSAAPGMVTKKIHPPQVPSLPVKPQLPRETRQVIFPSPGSSSSGISFDPDDVSMVRRKTFTHRAKNVIKPNAAKKNVSASSSKKDTNIKKKDTISTKEDVSSEGDDAWGFNM